MNTILLNLLLLFQPQFFPETASSEAGKVDALFFFMLAVCGSVALLVCGLLAFFAIKYRRRETNQLAQKGGVPRWLEVGWIVTPLVIFLGMFYWGATLYFNVMRPPEKALEINVIAKQWMWKFQHQGGQRELNELHVPVNQPVKITVTSQDVIHSFFVPAFRLHFDVVPGRYRATWFKPTQIGEFQLECSQYCGTQHSKMIGKIIVMSQADYENWLALGADESIASKGQNLFRQLACNACHTGDATARAPLLQNLYNSTANLEKGEKVKVDENYIRNSILNPESQIVAGYKPIMPTFKGQLDEEQLLELVAYIKSLGAGREQIPPNFSPGAPQPETVENAIRQSEKGGNTNK
ncbi:MAG: cytochrome c oxidase subunit II [Acidobacteriota bacterium]|nr:cytochrome c oxidase subunit II [Acidobacteriota bacterium]